MNALLGLGYARPLEATDLWKLQPDRGAAHIGKLITESFDRRHKAANEYNERLANGEIGPGLKGVWWSLTGNRAEKERDWRENTGKRKANLALALNDSVKWWFWSAGLLKLVGDTAQVTSPLVMKVCGSCFFLVLSLIRVLDSKLSYLQENRIMATKWAFRSQASAKALD